MDTQEYTDRLKDYISQFADWWCKPYEKFFTEYDRQNRSFISRLIPVRINTSESMEKFNWAAKQFEKDVRQKYDLIDEIFNFLDVNYEAYLHATDAQSNEIRSLIGNTFYKGPDTGITHYMGNYMQTLLFEYVVEHVLAKLKNTSEEAWLTRGLVAISIENCCEDFRETITCLAKLYVAAERKNMNPDAAFQRIAEISSKQPPKGDDTSVREMMANIGSYAATEYERSMQK